MVSLLPDPRPAVHARHGVVATSHPAAARVGLAVLRDGGSAVDAAVATAAALTVVEPTSNGLGGDAFALVWDGGALHGYNGSGRAPVALTRDAVCAAGHTEMPLGGWGSVTVPGQVRAWADLHARFGNLSWERLLGPAADLAAQGTPVTEVVADFWQRTLASADLSRPEQAAFRATFAADGRAPRAGERVTLPGHARTLRRLAQAGAEDFYTGEVADAIAAFSARTAGFISAGDLAAHAGEWVEPVSIAYGRHPGVRDPPERAGDRCVDGARDSRRGRPRR